MSTLSLDPGNHPQRRAALAAHALREALAAVGLLELVPECVGAVAQGRAVVRIGEIDAAAALALAMQLTRNRRIRRQRRPTQGTAESGT
ncbi:MAG: hypothetical protein ACRDRL_01900 [Sciscionella sp.]